MMAPETIKVERLVPCPTCGAYWGIPENDDPNRPKVAAIIQGLWWWRCYNPVCQTAYYQPETGKIEAVEP